MRPPPKFQCHDLSHLQQYFGSLSCWNIYAKRKLRAYSPNKLFLRMSLYICPLIMPSIVTSRPTPEAVKQPIPLSNRHHVQQSFLCILDLIIYWDDVVYMVFHHFQRYFTWIVARNNHIPKIGLFHILFGHQWSFLGNASTQLKFVSTSSCGLNWHIYVTISSHFISDLWTDRLYGI